MPVYLLDNSDPHVIEYRERDAFWHIRQCSTGQVLAICCAESPGFPTPILWTPVYTSLSLAPSRCHPVSVSGAGNAAINGTYFPNAATSSAAACARQLRCRASLEFSTSGNHWVLSHTTEGPCYYFCPNSPRSNQTGTSQDQHSDAVKAPPRSPISDHSGVCQALPSFDDGEWKELPHCASLPSHAVPKCRLLEIDTQPIASTSHFNWNRLDFASQFCVDLPPSLFVAAAIAAESDAALFEGHYRFADLRVIERTSNLHVLFLNDESGHQLLLVVSTVWIERVSLTVDGEVLFEHAALEQAPLPLATLVTDDHSFSIDLFRLPKAPEAAPAFKLRLPQGPKESLSKKSVVQPHMMPAFIDPARINSIKEMMSKPEFDARSFWQHALAQMIGHSEIANSNALHRVLVRYARIVASANSSALTLPITGVFQEGVG